jgi:hypothetical protein
MDSEVGIDLYEQVKCVPAQIRILGGLNDASASSSPELDTVDANVPETFTLEEFRKIITDFRRAGKDFIIARVTTPDPYRQDVLYNYYYAASEVNKLLFKYESERRLLHRMKVRNPLNNMYIIGQVYYYKITVYEVDRAIVEYYFEGQQKPDRRGRRSFSAVFRTSNTAINEDVKNKKARDTLDINKEKSCDDVTAIKNPLRSYRRGKL